MERTRFGESITRSRHHFDLLFRTIYIETERHVYIFFLHHSPSHLSCLLRACVHLFHLLPSSSTASIISPPLSPCCVFFFSLSSGSRLHADTLWITELQDTASKNCSIFAQSGGFFFLLLFFLKLRSLTCCCNSYFGKC